MVFKEHEKTSNTELRANWLFYILVFSVVVRVDIYLKNRKEIS